jgi:hypothetical protein
MIKTMIFLILIGVFTSCSTSDFEYDRPVQNGVENISISNIASIADTMSITRVAYEEGRVKAFTDITFFDDQFFLVFRESDQHAYGQDGIIHIYNSSEGTEWSLTKAISVEGVDLRDPHFAINNDKLYLYVHGSKYDNQTLTEFSDYRLEYNDINTWQEPENIFLDNNSDTSSSILGNEAWPWRITWHNSNAYTIGYNGFDIFDVYKSQNGINFERQNAITDLPFLPTEARIRVNDNDEFFSIVRRIDGTTILGKTFDPEIEWNWFGEIPFVNFRGPNFVITDSNKMIFSGGFYSWVYLGVYDINDNTFEQLLDIPSFGDGSYPGMVIKDDFLWLSYYTSFENDEGSSVYVAKINLNYFSL